MPDALPARVVRSLDRFVERLQRTPLDELATLAARPLDPEAHALALAEAERLAREHGRGPALADARELLREWVLRTYTGVHAIPGFGWPAQHDPRDRALLVTALDHAATALVVSDLLDEGSSSELLGPLESLSGPA